MAAMPVAARERRDVSKIVPALGCRWLTPLYDTVVALGLGQGRFRSALVEQAKVHPGDAVLDLGCGTGSLAIAIGCRVPGVNLVGLDADAGILAIAGRKTRRAGIGMSLDLGHSTSLPYPDAWFDRVFSSLFFHHLLPGEKRKTAAEVLRVLRPGGELHVADWGRPSTGLMRALFVSVRLLDGDDRTRESAEGKLPGILAEAGFEGVEVTGGFDTGFGSLELLRAARPRGTGRSR